MDQSYQGGQSDGSASDPYVTIGQALSAVDPNGQIAVAQGTYTEQVVLDRPIRFAGRCASLVRIEYHGTADDDPTLHIPSGGSGSSISGITIRGTHTGILVDGSTNVQIRQVQVLDTGYHSIWLRSQAQAEVISSAIVRAVRFGIASEGSHLSIQDTVVKHGVPEPGQTRGRSRENDYK